MFCFSPFSLFVLTGTLRVNFTLSIYIEDEIKVHKNIQRNFELLCQTNSLRNVCQLFLSQRLDETEPKQSHKRWQSRNSNGWRRTEEHEEWVLCHSIRVLSKSNPLSPTLPIHILWTTHFSKILDIYKPPSPYHSWQKDGYGRHKKRISAPSKMKVNRNNRQYPSWAGQQQTHLLFHTHLKNDIRSIKFSYLWQKTPNSSGLNKVSFMLKKSRNSFH